MAIDFLRIDDVLAIHRDQIERYGGETGVRDVGLLESAVTMPAVRFGQEMAHPDIFQMAAAYMFHIVQNHPFVDGNKRTGAVAAVVFLSLNEIDLEPDEEGLEAITMAVAEGRADKDRIAEFFRKIAH